MGQKIRGITDKRNAWIILIIAEILIVLALSLPVCFREPVAADYSEEEMTVHPYGEGFQKSIGTKELFLSPGIYELTVLYSAEQKDRKAVNAFAVTESGDERYTESLLADEIPLFGYREEATGRFYVRGSTVPVSIRCRNGDADFDLEVGKISVRSLNKLSAVRLMILWSLIFLLIDILLLCVKTGVFKNASAERKRAAFILIGMMVLLSVPAFFNGIPDGDDLEFHCFRIVNMAEGFLHGSFPVRLYALCGNGYGYPEGIMYGDVLLYLPALLYIAGFSLMTAYKVYLVFINISTAAVSYFCFKRLGGGRSSLGLLGSFLYSFSVWRLVDVCSRGAVGEYSAFVFLPLFVAALYELAKKDRDGNERVYIIALELIVAFTGLLQTHVFTTVMAGFFAALFILLSAPSSLRKDRVRIFFSSLAGAFLLNLGYILPFIHYYLVFPLNEKFETAGIQTKGIRLADLFLTGTYPPKSVGLALMLSLGMVIYFILQHRCTQRGALIKLTGLSALSLFMATIYFPFDWLKLHLPVLGPLLSSVQFPWRYLVIATVLITASLVLALGELKEQSGILLSFVLFSCCLLTLLQGSEYIGRWSEEENLRSFVSGASIDSFYGYTIFRPHDTDREALYEVPRVLPEGEGIEIGEWTRNFDEVLVPVKNGGKDGTILLPVLAYRGYRAEADGKMLQTSIGENYRLRVSVPAGFSGTVRAYFKESGFYRLAELVTLLTLIGMIVFFVKVFKRRS